MRTFTLTKIPAALLMAIALPVAGCAMAGVAEPEPYYDGPNVEGVEDVEGGATTALGTKNARLDGSLGDARNFSAAANAVHAVHGDDYTQIELWANGGASGQWSAMTSLLLRNGGLTSDAFVPGAKLHFHSDSSDGPSVEAIGCSGTDEDPFTLSYEVEGDEVDIEISASEHPGMIHLSFHVFYPGEGPPLFLGPQVIHAELDIVKPE